MKVEFLEPAEIELNEAASYYESILKGLGISFLDQIQFTIDCITENPTAWTEITPNIRRRMVNRFPYGVLYKIESDTILILAVMNLRREPNCWKSRL